MLAVLVGVWVFVSTHPIRPHDFWWHITIGKEVLEIGRIPQADVFSITAAGLPYPSYNTYWLMQVVLYGVYATGGPAGVVFFQSGLITATYGLLMVLAYRLTGSGRLAAWSTLAAVLTGFGDWNVRPQAVTFALGAACLLAIHAHRARPHPAWLAVFPLTMLVWVNSHGSFVIGLGLVGAWLADEVWTSRRNLRAGTWHAPALALALMALAVLANPRGVGMVSYVLTLTQSPVVRTLAAEWQAPNPLSLFGGLFYAVMALTALTLLTSPRRPTLFELAVVVGLGVLGGQTARGMVWFGLAVAPVLAVHWAARWPPQARAPGSPMLNWSLVGLWLTLAFLALPWLKPLWPLPPDKAGLVSAETPVAATRFLLNTPQPQPLFNFSDFGSYLIWEAYPAYRVFVDPRFELYSVQVWNDYLAIQAVQADWEARLQNYGVQTLMLSPVFQPELVQAVRQSSHWREVYADPVAVIAVRMAP